MKEENVEKIVVPNYEEKPKKKRGKIILIIILLLIAIGIGLYVGYQKLNNNPLSIYKKAINETYELLDGYLLESLNSDFKLNYLEDAYTLDTNFTLNTNDDQLSVLNDYKYALAISLDYPNEILNINATLGNQSEEIINLIISYINDNAYIKSDEIFDKVLNIGQAELDFNMNEFEELEKYNITYDNLHVILYSLKNIIINSLDKNKLSISDETIKINNKSIDAKKATYILDEENIKRTYNYFVEEIKKDEELLNALSSVSGTTKNDIISLLEEEKDFSDIDTITINLYTRNNEFIAGTLTLDNEEIIRFTYENNKLSMYIGDEYTNLNLDYENNKINLSYSEYDEEVFNLTYANNNDEIELNFTTDEYGTTNTYYLKFTNLKQNANEISANVSLKYENVAYEDINTFTLDGTFKLTKGKIESLDVDHSIDVNSLTEEEQLTIYNNLLKVLEKINFDDIYNIL